MVMKVIVAAIFMLISAIDAQDDTTTEASILSRILYALDPGHCPVPPKICPNVNVTFYLYNRTQPDNPQILDVSDPSSIQNANFVPNEMVVLLIHGYATDHNLSPIAQLKPAYFKHYDYNIISVDYAPLVKDPCYVQAVQNVPLIANCTAQLLDTLVSEGKFKPENLHIVGYSLGGQVAGEISNYLQYGKPEWVTGLDPAFLLFTTPDPSWRLDETDGKFVDVIHTNPLKNGKLQNSGKIDFFVNKGSIQPGCEIAIKKSDCSHSRAPEYYAESINTTGNKFIGKPCDFEGVCYMGVTLRSTPTAVMGEYVDKSMSGSYFVETNSEPPYAKG